MGMAFKAFNAPLAQHREGPSTKINSLNLSESKPLNTTGGEPHVKKAGARCSSSLSIVVAPLSFFKVETRPAHELVVNSVRR
jgi:hypothetical protein